MGTKKLIEQEEWQDRVDAFTSGNKGRICTVVAEGNTLGSDIPFVSLSYDPKGKGNDIMITLEGSTHTVFDPEKLYITKKSDGVVSEIEIVGKHKKSTLIKLL